jgi:hypothetical protein
MIIKYHHEKVVCKMNLGKGGGLMRGLCSTPLPLTHTYNGPEGKTFF